MIRVIDISIDTVISGKFNECLWFLCTLEELLSAIERDNRVLCCMEDPDRAG